MSGTTIVTSLGRAEPDRIIVRGYDLCQDLIGKVSFGDMAFLILTGRKPGEAESRMTNAMLACLVEHGFTPQAVAARLTYRSAPEAVQGAVASAILGAGSVYLGASERCAQMMEETFPRGTDPTLIERAADSIVQRYLDRKAPIPGIGHRLHRDGDPRALRLFAVANETGVSGAYCQLINLVGDKAQQRTGRKLPVNVTGAIAAVTLDMSLPWQLAKAYAIIGRTLGVLGHLSEEVRTPMGDRIMEVIDSAVQYQPEPER